MTGRLLGNVGRRAGVVMGLATLGVGIGAAPAFAATTGTSHATANAIGGTLINTGTCSASNNGTMTTGATTGPCTNTGPTITSPNGQLVTASVLTQAAVANQDGTSAACAGVSGPGGGIIQVGPNLPCTFNTSTSAVGGGGVNLLGGLLTANAIFATCSATAAGAPTGSSTLANIALGTGGLLGLNTLSGSLPTSAGNTTTISVLSALNVNLGSLLQITSNTQTNTNGTLHVTALTIQVLASNALLTTLGLNTLLTNGLVITIGNVTCGPNAALAGQTPAFPAKGLPIAGGVLALAGGAAYLGRRRLMGVRA